MTKEKKSTLKNRSEVIKFLQKLIHSEAKVYIVKYSEFEAFNSGKVKAMSVENGTIDLEVDQDSMQNDVSFVKILDSKNRFEFETRPSLFSESTTLNTFLIPKEIKISDKRQHERQNIKDKKDIVEVFYFSLATKNFKLTSFEIIDISKGGIALLVSRAILYDMNKEINIQIKSSTHPDVLTPAEIEYITHVIQKHRSIKNDELLKVSFKYIL